MQSRYNQAKLSIHDRGLKVAAVVESLEREMELLCLTGVEDQLQADVRPTLELLRNAGIKVSKENNTSIALLHFYSNTLNPRVVVGRTNRGKMFIFYRLFCLDLDVNRGQAGDGHMHREKLPFGLQKPRHPRVQAGALRLHPLSPLCEHERTQSIRILTVNHILWLSNRSQTEERPIWSSTPSEGSMTVLWSSPETP